MNALLIWLSADWPWIAALTASTLAGAWLERTLATHARNSRRRRWRGRPPAKSAGVSTWSAAPFDPAEQLRIVERAAFNARRVLNRGEERLMRVLEQACAAEAPDWRVMAQVSLGEILSSSNEAAFRAINSKRVDLLLVGADGMPRHAIELQGAGHHLGPAATRDAIKKEALRRAGVGYVEVLPGDTPAEVRRLVAKLARRETEGAAKVDAVA